MRFNLKIVAVFALFLVVLSATAVSAEENVTVDDTSAEDIQLDDAQSDEESDDEIEESEDEAVDEENATMIIDTYDDSLDEEVSSSDDSSASLKELDNNATGNPILVLLAACAILGGASLRRK